jgi:hypothetical protein
MWIATQLALPNIVSENDDRRGAGEPIFGIDKPPKRRTYAEDSHKIRRNDRAG